MENKINESTSEVKLIPQLQEMQELWDKGISAESEEFKNAFSRFKESIRSPRGNEGVELPLNLDVTIDVDGSKVLLPLPKYKFSWNFEVMKKLSEQVFPSEDQIIGVAKIILILQAANHGLELSPESEQ